MSVSVQAQRADRLGTRNWADGSWVNPPFCSATGGMNYADRSREFQGVLRRAVELTPTRVLRPFREGQLIEYMTEIGEVN